MKTLTDHDLALVTGGKTPDAAACTSSSNNEMLTALRGIQNTLEDLGKNNGGLFGGDNGLMFMTMALAMSRRSEVVVYGGRRRGYSWHVW
jgi:bacteriocin-like protein